MNLCRCIMSRTLAFAVLTWPLGAMSAGILEPLKRPAIRVSNPASAVYLGAANTGARVVVAVGERGLISLSDDAGAHWHQAQVPVSTSLTAVKFLTPDLGWAVGHGAVVLNTTNGGDSWKVQLDGRLAAQILLSQAEPGSAQEAQAQRLVEDGPDKPFFDLHLVSAQKLLVVGAYGLAFESKDGGRNWKSLSTRLDNPSGMHLYAVEGRGEQIYIAGEQGQLHRSDDGGASFTPLQSPYEGSWFVLAMLSDEQLLVAGLRGNAFVSHDRGQHWEKVSGLPPINIVSAQREAGGQVLLANQAGQLFRVDPQHLTSAAVPGAALGQTNSVHVLNDQRMLAMTMQGIVLHNIERATQ